MNKFTLLVIHLSPLLFALPFLHIPTGALEDQFASVITAFALLIFGFLRAVVKIIFKAIWKLIVFLLREFLFLLLLGLGLAGMWFFLG